MKIRTSRLLLLLLLVAGLLLAGCADQTGMQQQLQEKDARIAELEEQLAGWERLSDQQPLPSALKVIRLLRDKDFAGVADWVHPDKGLRFTPYAFIEVEKDRRFSAEEVAGLMGDETVYEWGFYDGSGEPIELTFADYYQRFVYDQDFVNAQVIGNNYSVSYGNTIDNIGEAYPDGKYIEFYFPGLHPEYGGADWRSLRTVFEQENDTWYLVGIVHSEWTI
ncbi:MAG: hypothetical protein ACOX2K_07690 [Bacillota bacterium]|jgi:hypothetical protein